MPQRSHRWYWVLLAFLVVLGLQHACQKDNPVRPGPAASARIGLLQADRAIIGPGESISVTATVVQGPGLGTPVGGVAVKFGEVGDGTSGTFSALENVTNGSGVAETKFWPSTGAPGLVSIGAWVDGTTEKQYVTIKVLGPTALVVSTPGGIRVLADGSTGLTISVVATTISADGAGPLPLVGLTIVLTAGDDFIDANHNGIWNSGEEVTADRNGDDLWTAEGSLPGSVTTDENGAASFRYTAGHAAGSVYLRMTGSTGGGVFEVLTLEQISPARIVTLESETTEMPADGVSQAAVTVSVKKWVDSGVAGWVLSPAANLVLFCTAGEPFTDTNGNGFFDPSEIPVDLNGNSRWDPMGSVPSSVTTGADGTATLTYRAGTEPGTCAIRATTTAGEFGILNLQLVSLSPARELDVILNPLPPHPFYADGLGSVNGCVIVMDDIRRSLAGKKATIVAGEKFTDVDADGLFDAGDVLLDDADGNGVWTSAGIVTWDGTDLTGPDGRACFTLAVGDIPMRVWIHAAVDGVIAEASFDLAAPLPVSSVTLQRTFEAMTILGGGGVTCNTLAATCLTYDDQPAPAGTIVRFCLTGPGGGEHLESAAAGCVDAVTDASGRAVAVLYSGTKPGWVEVIATSGIASGSMDIFLDPGAIRLTVALGPPDPPYYANGVMLVRGTVTARDLGGEAVVGKLVTVVVGEHFDDVNANGVFTPGTDRLLDDADNNGVWTSAGTVTVADRTGADGKVGFEIVVGTVPMHAWVHAAVDGVVADGQLDLWALPAAFLTCAADSSWLTPGNQCQVRTSVSDANHNPVVDGTPVYFTVDEGVVQGTDGPGVSYTQNGVAEATFTAPATSSDSLASIIASTPRASGGLLDCISDIQIRVGGGSDPVSAAFLTCAADSLQMGPGNQCRVWAQVLDVNHNPVSEGTAVYFTVDEGMVDPAVSYTVRGVAEATFKAPLTSVDGVASVIASTPAASGSDLQCASDIRIPGGFGTSCSVTLVPDLPEIAVRGTGATEQTLLHARVFDCRDMPVGAGEQVAFVITAGPGGGEAFTCCECDSVVILTDATGSAEVTLRAGTRSGTVEVRAYALSSVGVAAHSPVAIAAGPPAFLSVGVEQCNILTCLTVADPNPGVALVYDTYHNPVRDGTAVYFTANYGMVRGRTELGSSTTQRGEAVFEWLTTGWPECGVVTITASTLGGGLRHTVSFIGSGPAHSAGFASPSAAMVSLPADGATELPLRIELLDSNGLYVLPTDVDLTAVYGAIGSAETSADGCNASIAKATYVAPILIRDFSNTTPDDGVGGIDVVRVLGGFGPEGDTLRVQLLTGPASALKSVMEVGTSMRVSDQSYFTVTVKDAWGNPLGGHQLTITAPGATVTAQGITDSYGVVGGLSFTAPAVAGSVYLEVRDMDPVYSGNMILRQTVTVAE
jgi:hypothetical protein